MANPTSNFGWQMPTSTDLVTDLPADFEVFGQAVDTTLVDLKGGTTNQVLAKNSDTDMDFKWVADAAGMTNPMTTTGDTIYSSSGSTPARLGIGSTGEVLTVAAGLPSWAALPAAGGANWTLLNTGGTTLSGSSTVTVSGISGADKVMVLVGGASTGAVNPNFKIRLNADSGNNYTGYGAVLTPSSTYSASAFDNTDGGSIFGIYLGNQSTNTGGTVSGHVSITGCNAAGVKLYQSVGGATATGGTDQGHRYTGGAWNNSATVTSVSIVTSSGTFDNGLIFVYTSA